MGVRGRGNQLPCRGAQQQALSLLDTLQHFTCATSLNYPANLLCRYYYYHPHFTDEKTGHKRVKHVMFEVTLLVRACARDLYLTCLQKLRLISALFQQPLSD